MTHELTTPSNVVAQGVLGNSFKRLVDAPVYHADLDILSCSMLKSMLISPAHFIEACLHKKTSRAMELGTLLHLYTLEPHTANAVVAVFPDELDTPEGKAFKAVNQNRICVSIAERLSLQVAAEKVRSSLFRGRPFHKFIEEGEVEPSIYFTDPTTGLECRTRPDLLHPEFTFDLKSTRFANARKFQMDAVDKGYDLQAFMYSYARCLFEGSKVAKPFVFVPLESTAPHSVFFMPANDDFISNGFEKYKAAMAGIKACRQANHWPAPGGEVEMDLSPWQVFKSSNSDWSMAA